MRQDILRKYRVTKIHSENEMNWEKYDPKSLIYKKAKL